MMMELTPTASGGMNAESGAVDAKGLLIGGAREEACDTVGEPGASVRADESALRKGMAADEATTDPLGGLSSVMPPSSR